MRKPTIDWEAYREQLCSLRYEQKKSLTDINKILFEQLGRCVTNARLSQVFTGWKNEVTLTGKDSTQEIVNAN